MHWHDASLAPHLAGGRRTRFPNGGVRPGSRRRMGSGQRDPGVARIGGRSSCSATLGFPCKCGCWEGGPIGVSRAASEGAGEPAHLMLSAKDFSATTNFPASFGTSLRTSEGSGAPNRANRRALPAHSANPDVLAPAWEPFLVIAPHAESPVVRIGAIAAERREAVRRIAVEMRLRAAWLPGSAKQVDLLTTKREAEMMPVRVFARAASPRRSTASQSECHPGHFVPSLPACPEFVTIRPCGVPPGRPIPGERAARGPRTQACASHAAAASPFRLSHLRPCTRIAIGASLAFAAPLG